MFILNIT